MYLIIKEDQAEKAKSLMGTNRPYKAGDKVTGDVTSMSRLANKNPDVFEICGVEKKTPTKKTRGKSEERKAFGPGQDKLVDGPQKKKNRRKRGE